MNHQSLLGMALAVSMAFGHAIAGDASPAIRTTPPHVTAGTTGQTADAIERVAIHDRAFAFTLNSPVMGHTDANGRVIGQLPSGDNVLSLTQVVLYDIAEMGEASLSRANLPTLAVYNGETLLGTANYDTEAAPEVAVNLADGSTATLRPVVYAFTEPVSVNATTTYTLRLNAAGVTPVLPLFANATSDAGFGILNYEIWAPYVTFVCQGSVNVETFTVSKDSDLSALGTYTDGASTALVFTLAEGVTLTLDERVQYSTLIFETAAPAANAPTVAFENINFPGAFVFRNAQGSDNGAIRVSGPWQDSSDNDSNTTWDPAALTVDCDLILASPLPFRGGNWFQDNDVRVLPGRTLRLETEADTAKRLPDVLLTAPSANLALADAEKNGDIPEKYLPLFDTTSGTVTLERPVAFGNHSNTSNDSQGSIFRIGNDEGKGYNFTLNVDKDFSSASRLVIGGDSGFTTLNLRGNATYSAKTINFDSNSKLMQSAGNLTLGSPSRNGWATWFLGDSSTLVFGDGDTENGLATATLHGIPYGSNDKTDYRGAADLTVNADATLLLNEYDQPAVAGTPDYALYPVGKRSLKVRGGTVKANTGAAVTMAFESPEPQAAPMAVAEIPGLEVAGSAALESADTTSSSLTLDALKGNGTVTLSGVVHIDSVRLGEDDTLTFDLRKGTDGADDAIGGSRVTIDAVTGTAGIVRFGLLGTDGTTGEQTVIDTLLAGGFTGTVGFLVPDYSTLDFEDTQLPELPFTLEVQPGQTVVMRLDQYADADILWPEDCSNVNLVLVEAGPFGGEASLPAWPEGVTFEFHRYDSNGHAALTPNTDYTFGRNDDGITIDLTWKDPVLTGKVAWLDMEFNNATSANSGWLRLSDDPMKNGMLRGDTGAGILDADEIIDDKSGYVDTFNPASSGLTAYYQPYIGVDALKYPERWSLVTRVMAPNEANTAILTIGANHKEADGDFDGTGKSVLALATGTLQTTDETTEGLPGDEIILWYIPNNSIEGMRPLASAKVPRITEMPHLVSILYDAGHVEVYFDGHCLIDTTLPEGTKIGPGLQAGTLMGGTNLSEALKEKIKPYDHGGAFTSTECHDGVIDFIRIYRGILSEAALDNLVRNNPYIDKHPADVATDHRDVRYVRTLENGGTELWVSPNAWKRQELRGSDAEAGGAYWYGDDLYDEPAEGAFVVIECKSDTTLQVNTTKHGLFPSANRVFSSLIVVGKSIGTIQAYGVNTDTLMGGTLKLEPYDDPNTPDRHEWYDDTDENGDYVYGTLRFSGGIGQGINQRKSGSGTFFGEGNYPKAAYFLADAHISCAIADLTSPDGVEIRRGVDVTFRADDLMTRGFDGEYFIRQVTGPLSGNFHDRPVLGDRLSYGHVIPNEDITNYDQQTSEFVWVPTFHNIGSGQIPESEWKLDDVTRQYGNPVVTSTGYGDDADIPQTGLFVRVAKVPGRLYLELNKDEIKDSGALSTQAWYRYGYHGDEPAGTVSHMQPEQMHTGDFEKAVALSIRLKNGKEKTLLADSVADGLTINELTIDKPKADDGTANETLQILPQAGTDNSLKVLEAISTDRRLEVYSAQGTGSEASAKGADGVKLHAVYDEATETNIGAKLYGVGTGEFVAGNSSINHALDGSSIARIESVGTIRFTAAQDLSATTLAAAEEAIVEQTGADNAFHAGAMELAKGSRFTFASSEASVDGAVTLTGNATIEGTGTAARLAPVAGITGQAGTETLTLDAAENASWKLLNSEVGGLPLTKTGAGTADIATDLPPNAGKVDVQKGTLAVATGLAGEHQAVGQKGLNVEAGATLDATASTIDTDVLAEIPAEQTVSGLGRIEGTLRLETNATLDATKATATDDGSLSVRDVQTDGLTALADVGVSLPEDTAEGLVFLRSDETKLNWTARARLLATTPNATRWDVLLRYRRNADEAAVGTNYLVGAAGLDVPNFDTIPEEVPEEDRPSKDEADENNKWPDGSGDAPAVDDEVTDQIQDGGNVAGEAEGYTKANTQWLMAPDIANAYACFGNVWTLAPRSLSADSEDYATRDLLMAYEFGISRMAFSQDNAYIVIEATLRNALADCGYFTDEQLQGAGALKPIFLTGVTVAIVGKDGTPLKDVEEINASTAASHGFTPIETATDLQRHQLPRGHGDEPDGAGTPARRADRHAGKLTDSSIQYGSLHNTPGSRPRSASPPGSFYGSPFPRKHKGRLWRPGERRTENGEQNAPAGRQAKPLCKAATAAKAKPPSL